MQKPPFTCITPLDEGKLAVPPEFLESLHPAEGAPVRLSLEDGQLIASPEPHTAQERAGSRARFEELRTFLKENLARGGPSLSDELINMREEDEADERREWDL